MADEIVLTLPEPPSANTYWRRAGTRIHVSAEAKAYKEAVSMLASRYRLHGMCAFASGDLVLTVVWHRSAKRGDLGNRLKVLEDALQGTIYVDDKQISQIWARRVDADDKIPKGFMRVAICRETTSLPRARPATTSTTPVRRPRRARSVSPRDTTPNA